MKYYIVGCLIALSITVQGQSKYDVALIPKELLSYASTVVRNSEVRTEVKSFDNTSYYVKKAITVLNAGGDDDAEIVLWYTRAGL